MSRLLIANDKSASLFRIALFTLAFFNSAFIKLLCRENECSSSPGGISGISWYCFRTGRTVSSDFSCLGLEECVSLFLLLNSLNRLISVCVIAPYIVNFAKKKKEIHAQLYIMVQENKVVRI